MKQGDAVGLTMFDRFVQEELEKANSPGGDSFDAGREKEEWIRSLDDLYAMVGAYLGSYLDAGQIKIDYRSISLNEEYIGDYSVREMLITVGTKVIRMEPIGTFLIGSKGRVDVVGPVARARLLLVDSKIRFLAQMVQVSVDMNGGLPQTPVPNPHPIEWVWRLVTRPPQSEIVVLTKETFLSMLVEIANG